MVRCLSKPLRDKYCEVNRISNIGEELKTQREVSTEDQEKDCLVDETSLKGGRDQDYSKETKSIHWQDRDRTLFWRGIGNENAMSEATELKAVLHGEVGKYRLNDQVNDQALADTPHLKREKLGDVHQDKAEKSPREAEEPVVIHATVLVVTGGHREPPQT